MAHRVFLTTNRFGTPFVAILTTALLGSAAYLSVSYRAMQALLWLLNLSAVSGLISAVVLCFAYIRMHAGMKAQGYNRDGTYPLIFRGRSRKTDSMPSAELSYRSWGQPYVAWFAMICSAVIVFFSGFQVFLKGNFTVAGFFTNYISVILFAGKIWNHERAPQLVLMHILILQRSILWSKSTTGTGRGGAFQQTRSNWQSSSIPSAQNEQRRG